MADGILHGGQAIAAAINEITEGRRKQREMRNKALLEAANTDPTLFTDPNVRKSLTEYYGDKDAVAAAEVAAHAKTPGGQAKALMSSLGIDPTVFGKTVAAQTQGIAQQPGPTTEEQQAAVETQAKTPGFTEAASLAALPDVARARGMGVSISSKGVSVRSEAPSQKDVGEATSLVLYSSLRNEYLSQGLDPDQADRLAARNSVEGLARQGIVAGPELRRIAFADADANIEADKAALVARAQKKVELETARPIAAERTAGEVTGKAAGEAAVPFQTMEVKRPDGTKVSIPLTAAPAVAATGIPSATLLGKSPSKEQLSQAALRGSDIVMGQDGNLVAIPIGEGPSLPKVATEALIQGPEALQALDEVRNVINGLDDPAFLALHPSEATEGRAQARSVGYLKSWLRNLSDPADAIVKRGELRQLGFRLARLLGSNSQLSDAERENAQKVLDPVIKGTATQEQIKEAKASVLRYLGAADKRRDTKTEKDEGKKLKTEEPKSLPTTEPGKKTSLGDRQNNPGHVKVTAFTRKLPGFTGEGKSATDGGKFAIFDSPEAGRNAIGEVLTRIHGDKRVSNALRVYSGGGYGDNVAKRAGLDPMKRVSELTGEEKDRLIDEILRAEGSTTGFKGSPSAPRKIKLNDGSEWEVAIR